MFPPLSLTTFIAKLLMVLHPNAAWRGENLRNINGRFYFDIQCQNGHVYEAVEFGNCRENTMLKMPWLFLVCVKVWESQKLKFGLLSKHLKEFKRRFDFHIRRDDLVIIDDYAHHPTEITAFLSSLREIYPTKKITTVFQPHLFSRTRDFMQEFARSLELTDELFLLDIYPARELPMEGITSQVLFDQIHLKDKQLSSKETIVSDLQRTPKEVLVIVGAGDIDTCVLPIVKAYSE
jgi:UDP-N-acetylmuramate--alanine ligase